jgi:hypothetical protein
MRSRKEILNLCALPRPLLSLQVADTGAEVKYPTPITAQQALKRGVRLRKVVNVNVVSNGRAVGRVVSRPRR